MCWLVVLWDGGNNSKKHNYAKTYDIPLVEYETIIVICLLFLSPNS